MKLWIVLALIGMASAAPCDVGAQGKVDLGMAIKKFCPIAQQWIVERYITDPDEMAKIAAQQGNAINVIDVNDASEIKCANEDIIVPTLPELSGPEFIPPCADFQAPSQTKVVQRQPCFRGYAPTTIDVDGQKWRCTNIGRSQTSPCLPQGRVVDRACTKTIAPCAQPEVVYVDEPCAAIEKIIAPCTVSASSSLSQEVKIVQDPCEVRVVEPCVTERIIEPCFPERVIEPCFPERVIEPCEIKLPEINISSSASASACSTGATADARLEMPELGTVLGDLKGAVSSSFSSSASSSSSGSSSSFFSDMAK